MKRLWLSLTLALSFVVSAQAADQQIPPVMYEFLGQIFRLQPLMFSTQEFTKKANETKIKESLAQLSEISKRLPHTQRLNTASFQVSALALQNHMKELTTAFNDGRKEYSRRMLVATLDGCSSCHTQVPGRNLPQWKFRDDEVKGDEFVRGEFLFAVRHYEEALKSYEIYLNSFDSKKDDQQSAEIALRRALVVYVRVLRNPARGILFLERQVNSAVLPKSLKIDIGGWIAGLKDLQKSPPPDAQKASRAEVEAYAQKTIEPLLSKRGAKFQPKAFISFLAASGVIADFINSRPDKDLSANMLFMLARCDEQISQGYFFSMTDNYLRECISRFPSDPIAKKCFDELESSLTSAFTGSRGVDLPPDVKQELTTYRKMMNLPATPAK